MNSQLSSRFLLLALLAILSALSFPIPALSQGTAFTYQGRLNDANGPATGLYDLTFGVYDGPNKFFSISAATPLGNGIITNTAVPVTNGLFTVTLDFGYGVFSGNARWLEIGVQVAGGTNFIFLTPRQGITATPYAQHADNAAMATIAGSANSVAGANITGQVPLSKLPAVVLTNGAVLLGNGMGVSNVNAATLNGVSAASLWQTGGNNATSGQFLGSTNNEPLEFRVNNSRVLRFEAVPPVYDIDVNYSGLVNIIAGSPYNLMAPGVQGSVIAGGGSEYYDWGGGPNTIMSDVSFIGGGFGNSVMPGAPGSVLGGGGGNIISTNSSYSVLNGGFFNSIQDHAGSSVLAGGGWNKILDHAFYATIPGGVLNSATNFAFAAGTRARAVHTGAFVWADSQFEDFTSTGFNQFLVRAAGGVGINKTNPATALDVNGTITATAFAGNGAGLTNVALDKNLSNNIAWLNQPAEFNNDVAVDGSLSVSGYTSAGGGFSVVGSSYFSGQAQFQNGIFSWGTVAVASTLNVAGLAQFNNVHVAGNLLAGTLAGDGGSLTNLNAANIVGGPVLDSLLSTNVAFLNGSNRFSKSMTATNANNLFAGTFAGDGSGLTNLNALALAMGSITADKLAPDVKSNVALLNQSNAFSQSISVGGTLEVRGNSSINSQLSVAGDLSAGGSLNVMSHSYFNGLAHFNSDVFTWGNLQALGSFQASGSAFFDSNVQIAGNLFAGQFYGNGTGVTNVNAAYLGGVPASAFLPATNYSGTLIASNAQLVGLIRSGSETGTTDAPMHPGLVIRRINSLSTASNNIVARTDVLTLERDGSNEGLLIRYPATPGKRFTVNCIAQSYYGTNIFFHGSITSPGVAGVMPVLNSSQRAVHAEISFGDTFNAEHLTQVSLDRFDDGSTSDYYWVGTVTSTYNQ